MANRFARLTPEQIVGPEIAAGGYTKDFNDLRLYRRRLGISWPEYGFIECCLQELWNPSGQEPSMRFLSAKYGEPRATLYGQRASLIRKGIMMALRKTSNGGADLPSEPDFAPMWEKIRALKATASIVREVSEISEEESETPAPPAGHDRPAPAGMHRPSPGRPEPAPPGRHAPAHGRLPEDTKKEREKETAPLDFSFVRLLGLQQAQAFGIRPFPEQHAFAAALHAHAVSHQLSKTVLAQLLSLAAVDKRFNRRESVFEGLDFYRAALRGQAVAA